MKRNGEISYGMLIESLGLGSLLFDRGESCWCIYASTFIYPVMSQILRLQRHKQGPKAKRRLFSEARGEEKVSTADCLILRFCLTDHTSFIIGGIFEFY